MIYSACFETMNVLLAYLTENCCQGRPERCLPRRSRAPRSSPARPKEQVS
jgi:hypothetical protein